MTNKTARVQLAVAVMLLAATPTWAQSPILQFRASDYDPATGVWSNAANPSNNAVVSRGNPSLVAGQTPNGSSVVRFDGNTWLSFQSAPSSTNYSVFAYLRPDAGNPEIFEGFNRTIVGGENNDLHYVIGQGDRQQVARSGQVDLGVSTTAVSLTTFNNVSVTVGESAGSFRLNGFDDGVVSGVLGGSRPVRYIGVRDGSFGGSLDSPSGPKNLFRGDIAEIRVYDTMLSLPQRIAVEQELNQAYAVPEPSTVAMALAGLACGGYLRFRRRKQA